MAEFQPLHRNTTTQSNLQRKLFQKNLPGQQGTQFASPTDNLMSPCSQKLNAHKNRFFAKSKATKLNFEDIEDKENH